MISQFFILSARGDTIINRDFRHDLVKNTPEIFFRQVKLDKGDAPPIFNTDGVSFVYLKKTTGLYLVMTTRGNISPSFIMEILNRISKIIKDFCGVLTEEAIRKNFVLIYEIIDEALDFGYPQLTATDQIKKYIVNEPIPVDSAKQLMSKTSAINLPLPFGILKQNTQTSKVTTIPIDNKNKKNEIFVDVYERISITFNSTGYVINSSIEGCIQMKSYLLNNPEIKLALNDNLVLGRNSGIISNAVLDDYNFHECVNASEFEVNKIVRIRPPEGEFVAMNYRVTSEFDPPFRFFTYIEEPSNYKLEVTLRIKATMPKEYSGNNVVVKFPVPKNISNVYCELPKGAVNQTAEYESATNMVKWSIRKFSGTLEHSLKAKISLQSNVNTMNARKEIGPIVMSFEIPMYNLSGLQIKYLKIEEAVKSKVPPNRWVRFITQSSSYVCRLT